VPCSCPEIVICAAVLTEEGKVFRGHRHHDAMHAAGAAGYRVKRNGDDGQGFITLRNRFVDRDEGLRLQLAAGIQSAAIDGYRRMLFSEDLY
jgi:hypothetical protein